MHTVYSERSHLVRALKATLRDCCRPRLCENESGTDLGKKSTSQTALHAFFLTEVMVRRPLNFMSVRVFTQPRPKADSQMTNV